MPNIYLTYFFKTIFCGTLLITGPLNAIHFFIKEHNEKRDWKIASNAIIAHDHLNKICQTAAALIRVNEELDEDSPSKRVYTAIIQRLDLLSEGLGTILDSDNLVSDLIPRDKAEETSFNRIINTHHDTLRDLVSKGISEYPALVSLAKKQIDADNKKQESMRFELTTKTDLILTEASGNFKARMDQYNAAHESLHRALQELYDSLRLRTVLDKASEHLQVESAVKYKDLHSLVVRIQTQSDDIKESAKGCYLSAQCALARIKKTSKSREKSLKAAQEAHSVSQQLNEMEKRKIIPRLITKKLLCPTKFCLIRDKAEEVQKFLDAHPFNGIAHVNLTSNDNEGKKGIVKTVIFTADKDKEFAIKPAFVTPLEQLLLKTRAIPLLVPFVTHKSVCQIAQSETGDCYLSRSGSDFYKVSNIVGLLNYNDDSK
jgi:hypothetical protein